MPAGVLRCVGEAARSPYTRGELETPSGCGNHIDRGDLGMATNATRTQQATVNAVVQAALAKETGARRAEGASSTGTSSAGATAGETPRRAVGYGLPCAKCHLYYPADLDVCPTCKHNQRVSPVAPKVTTGVSQAAIDPIPDSEVVEQEREEFLRQFKSQLMEAHAGVVNPPEAMCKFGEHHSGRRPARKSARDAMNGCRSGWMYSKRRSTSN